MTYWTLSENLAGCITKNLFYRQIGSTYRRVVLYYFWLWIVLGTPIEVTCMLAQYGWVFSEKRVAQQMSWHCVPSTGHSTKSHTTDHRTQARPLQFTALSSSLPVFKCYKKPILMNHTMSTEAVPFPSCSVDAIYIGELVVEG